LLACDLQVLFLKNNLDLGLDVVGTFATILPQVTNYKAALEVRESDVDRL
jgi:hypothetical protein